MPYLGQLKFISFALYAKLINYEPGLDWASQMLVISPDPELV